MNIPYKKRLSHKGHLLYKYTANASHHHEQYPMMINPFIPRLHHTGINRRRIGHRLRPPVQQRRQIAKIRMGTRTDYRQTSCQCPGENQADFRRLFPGEALRIYMELILQKRQYPGHIRRAPGCQILLISQRQCRHFRRCCINVPQIFCRMFDCCLFPCR